MRINITKTNFGHNYTEKTETVQNPNNNTEYNNNLLRNALLGLAILGSSLATTSCYNDYYLGEKKQTEKTVIIPKSSINKISLDNYKTANEKANFLFHELGITDKDKTINDIETLSFTNSQGRKYVFNNIIETDYGPYMEGYVKEPDGKEKYKAIHFGVINTNEGKKLILNDDDNNLHSNSIIYQAGWKYSEGEIVPVFYEERIARDRSLNIKTSGHVYDSNNIFELDKTSFGITSIPLPNTKPFTGEDFFNNIEVVYKQ